MAVLLFGVATAFSQAYVLTVNWEVEECSCNDQGESYYEVRYNIYDYIHDVVVQSGATVRVDFGTYTVDIQVPEVNTNCTNQLTDPDYLVRIEVAVVCDSYTPPQDVCSTGTIPYYWDCDEFADGEAETLTLEFVE